MSDYRIIKNMWRKVGECGTLILESGGSGYVHGRISSQR